MTTFVVCEDSGEYDMYSRILIGVVFHELDAHKLATHREILIFRFEGEGRSTPTEILTVAQARDRVRYWQDLIKAGRGPDKATPAEQDLARANEQTLTKAKATLGTPHQRLNAMEHERTLAQVLATDPVLT